MYFWAWLILIKYLSDDYWHTKISFFKRQYIRELIAVSCLAFLDNAISRKQQDCPPRTAWTNLWFTAITWITSPIRLTLLYMRLRKLIEYDRKQDIKTEQFWFFFKGSIYTWAVNFIHNLIHFVIKHILWILCFWPGISFLYLLLVKRSEFGSCKLVTTVNYWVLNIIWDFM